MSATQEITLVASRAISNRIGIVSPDFPVIIGTLCVKERGFAVLKKALIIGVYTVASFIIGCGSGSGPSSSKGTTAEAVLSAVSLSFPVTSVGLNSPIQTVTLTNTGNATLTINSISLGGANPLDFSLNSNCSATLAVQATCALYVQFNPAAAYSYAAAINVVDNAANSPQTITLSGTGTAAPVVNISSTNLTFPITGVGITSAIQTANLTNTGNATLTISSISLGGANVIDFSLSNNCGTTLAAHAFCTLYIQFNPIAANAYTAAVNVVDNAANSPQTITLSGTGTVAPVVNISSTNLTFPATDVGSTSAIQTVTLANTGNATLTISSIGLGGANPVDFSLNTNCNGTLAVQATCTLNVHFTPAAANTYAAAINIVDNAANSPQSITLSGAGTTAPIVSLSSTTITFPATGVGSSSAQTLTLTNTGNAALNITSITLSGAFTQSNNCGTTLASGAYCTLNVIFKPPCTGTDSFTPGKPTLYPGSISVTDNALGSPQTLQFAGSGLSSAMANLTPGAILWGADGHRDKGGPYTAVSICQQITDLHQVFGSTPNTIFYRAWDSVHDYPNFDASLDVLQLQAAGIIPLMGVAIDPPSLPGGSVLANPASTYAEGYSWGYALAKSDAQAAPSNIYWFVGNEWNNLILGANPYPSDPTDPTAWQKEPFYQAYLGAMAGAIQAIRDVIPSAQIISGANGGTTSIGLTIALAQDLQAKGLRWDYTNLHWYNDYASTESYQAHYEAPAYFHGTGGFVNQVYDAYALLFPAGSALFVDEFGSSNGAVSTMSTVNDAGAGKASADLMSELLAHSAATVKERGIVVGTFYQLYPLLDNSGTSGLDKYLFAVNGVVTSLSGQGAAVYQAIGQNPSINATTNYSLLASPVTISSPGASANATITLVTGTGFSPSTNVVLKCIVWSESQTDPTLSPSCSFGGLPTASLSQTATTAAVTITTKAGTTVRGYVLTILGTVAGSSTDTNITFSIY